LGAASAAGATGGLDIWDPDVPTPAPIPILPANVQLPLRVLLSTGGTPQLIDDRSFELNGKIYRGTAAVVRLSNGKSAVVNTLMVDEYLYGVIPLEVSRAWPAAMLAAQAIVARTYALSRRAPARPYDLVADSSDQVYGGRSVETPATNAAVDATTGAVVTFNGAIASVFYMACCGGHTEDAGELWGRNSLPYLRGVTDPWCAGTPDYRWRQTIAYAQFVGALGPEVGGLGDLVGLTVTDLDPSGRPRRVIVRGTTRSAEIGIEDLRRALGPRALPSTFIQEIDLDGHSEVTIDGAGRGHGVGLCQWGARSMALQGRDPAAIVAFYFPGTLISRA
jgi:stage II sporulation protein D